MCRHWESVWISRITLSNLLAMCQLAVLLWVRKGSQRWQPELLGEDFMERVFGMLVGKSTNLGAFTGKDLMVTTHMRHLQMLL